MDTGQGKFEISDGTLIDRNRLENEYPNHGGWFRVDEIVELKGSRFRVKAVKPKELRLKLLPRKPESDGR